MNKLWTNLVRLMFEVSVRINACWINISKLHGAFDFTFMESLCDGLLFSWVNKNYLFFAPCQMIVKSRVLHLFPVPQTGSHIINILLADKFSKPKIAIHFNLLQVCPSVPPFLIVVLFIPSFFFFVNVWWQFSLFEFWCISLLLNKVFMK